MTCLRAVSIMLLLIAGCVQNPGASDLSRTAEQSGIVGGDNVKSKDPLTLAIARIDLEGEGRNPVTHETQSLSAYCTGSLIAPNLILTAAHCFDSAGLKASRIRFMGLASGSTSAKQVVIAPDRQKGNVDDGDLAVIILSKPVSKSQPVSFVGTRAQLVSIAVGTPLIVAGYGQARPPGRSRDDYQLGDNGEGTLRKGTGIFLKYDGQTNIEMTTAKGHPCHGDSGGPIFASIDGKLQLIAVTKSVEDGAKCGGYTGATLIASHQAWIQSMLALAQSQL